MSSTRLAAVLVVLAAFTAARPAAAQEVSGHLVAMQSGVAELDGMRGLSASFTVHLPLVIPTAVRVDALRVNEATNDTVVVCSIYNPNTGCNRAAVSTTLNLKSFRVSVMPELRPGGRVRLAAGPGLSVNNLNGDSRDRLGREGPLFIPRTAQLGRLLTAEVDVQPLARLPFTLYASGTSHWIPFNGCAPAYHDPFCGTQQFTEIRVGAGFRFPQPRPAADAASAQN